MLLRSCLTARSVVSSHFALRLAARSAQKILCQNSHISIYATTRSLIDISTPPASPASSGASNATYKTIARNQITSNCSGPHQLVTPESKVDDIRGSAVPRVLAAIASRRSTATDARRIQQHGMSFTLPRPVLPRTLSRGLKTPEQPAASSIGKKSNTGKSSFITSWRTGKTSSST